MNNENMLDDIIESEKEILTLHQFELYDKIMRDIVRIVKEGGQWDNVVSILGAAGCGKTFISTKIIKAMKKLGVQVQLTTPTHKALKVAKDMLKEEQINNIESSTIHSFLNLKLKPNFDSGLQELIAEEFNKKTKKTELLIVDESSMISKELFEHIEACIRFRRAKCVLFIGDKFQLPPVDGEQNPVFTMKGQYELTEVVRQAKDSPIIQLASDIRRRIENKDFTPLAPLVNQYACKEIEIFNDGKKYMSSFLQDEWIKRDQVIAAYTNRTVDAYNRSVRKRFWKDCGHETDDESTLPYLVTGDTVIFQDAHIENDTVIHSNNDIVKLTEAERKFDEELKCWYWICTDDEESSFKVIDPISKSNYDKYLSQISLSANSLKGFDRKKMWEFYYLIKTSFQNIKYCFSSTVHKLQGSTYEHCFIDLREMNKFYEFQDKEFIYRLAYVAVTRASLDIKILI
jgi:exodeoxyribonuclease-5